MISLASVVVAAFLVVTPFSSPLPSRAQPCANDGRFNSCNGNSQVVVSGMDGSAAADRRGSAGGGAPVVEPAGTAKLVACNTNMAAALAATGDTTASLDAGSCGMWKAGCDAATALDGRARTIAVRLIKQTDGSWSYNGGGCQVAGPAQVTAVMVRQQIARLVPSAAIGVAPQGSTLVNIQTIMWVATTRQRALAPLTILGRRVVVTLRFDHVVWDFGDGHTESSATPGKPYDETRDPCASVDCPDYYGHTYVGTGTMTLTAVASWAASFTVDGGQTLTIPGTVAGPAATTAVQVKQARGVLVPDPTPN